MKCALAPALNAEVLAECQKSPFIILCDNVMEKYFVIMVRYWCQSAGKPVTRFPCMPVYNIATARKHCQKILSHSRGAMLSGMHLICVVEWLVNTSLF